MPNHFTNCKERCNASRTRFQLFFLHINVVVLYLLAIRVQCCTCTVHGWFNEEQFHRKANYRGRCYFGVAFHTIDEAFSVRGGDLEGSDDYRPAHQSSEQERKVPIPPPPPPPPPLSSENHNDSRIKRVFTHNGNDNESTSAAKRTSVSNTPQQSLSDLVSESKRSDERKTDISNARLDYETKYYGKSRITKEPVHHMPTQQQHNASGDVVEKTNQTVSQNNFSDARSNEQRGRDSDVPGDDQNYNSTSSTAQHEDNFTYVIPDDDEFDLRVNKVHTGATINTGKTDTNVPIGASLSSANKPSNMTADEEVTHDIHDNPNISASVAEKEEALKEASHVSKTEAYDRFAETNEYDDFDEIGSDSEDSAALSKLQRSILMKSKSQDRLSNNGSISSWLMTGMSKVGKRLVDTAISSIWAPSRQDEKKVDSDSFTPTLASTQMKMPKGLGSEVLVKKMQVIQLSTSGPSPDAIWKTEENVLNHVMELFSLYFALWNIKCPKQSAHSGKVALHAKDASGITSNAPVPFQPGNLGTSLNHAESILVSAFLSNAVSSAILNDSIMNTILPAVYSHIDNYRSPIQPIRTKREKTVITKTTRARPTILSKIDTDGDMDDIDFARLLMELEGGPNEQIVEEIEYEYDEEPLFIDADDLYEVEDQDPDIAVIPDVEIDYLNDEQVLEIESELDDVVNSEIDNGTDDDDLLDDDELEVLEDARIDSSDWFSGDDEMIFYNRTYASVIPPGTKRR